MSWHFTGQGRRRPYRVPLPAAPSWRVFDRMRTGAVAAPSPEPADDPVAEGECLAPLEDEHAVWTVNAALLLRRPLLITGLPGSGKSTIARLVASELRLGPVLRWPITSSSRLVDGLYQYDAIGWVQEQNGRRNNADDEARRIEEARRIGRFIRLGPLGTALLPWSYPRVLLVDEIDKADIDLPNDLLHVLEEGQFEIPELFRLDDRIRESVEVFTADRTTTEVSRRAVQHGIVACDQFPVIIMTSNEERAFPPAFLRRCLRLRLATPTGDRLKGIVQNRVGGSSDEMRKLIIEFENLVSSRNTVAVDQLLNAVFLLSSQMPGADQSGADQYSKIRALIEDLG